MRVDLFGVRAGGRIEDPLIAPIRPAVPTLKPGKTYLLETVIRTLKLGHHFTDGTADSNEVWLEVTARSGRRVIGRSGALDENREVDPWSHFVNVFMLDRDGNRIDRRNAQDIFVPLYNHQIPPGGAHTVHYALHVPGDVEEPVVVEIKLNYRKFDARYVSLIADGQRDGKTRDPIPTINDLPVTIMARDRVVFPIERASADISVKEQQSPIEVWQRWNDYGIGMLLKGKAELRQAAEAFARVESLGRYDGPLNLARVYYAEGRLDEAVDAISRASAHAGVPPWTLAWLSGLVNREQGYLEQAEANFRSILAAPTQDMLDRGFDFRGDYEIINLLGQTMFDRARQIRGDANQARRDERLREAIEQFEKTLRLDPENVSAHYNLQLIHASLGQHALSQRHADLHAKYKTDDNARERAVALARRRYPAANKAAEAIVIYDLKEAHARP
jgi:tetratricopeptide (TPR) repeat protein